MVEVKKVEKGVLTKFMSWWKILKKKLNLIIIGRNLNFIIFTIIMCPNPQKREWRKYSDVKMQTKEGSKIVKCNAKFFYPGCDQSVKLYISSDEHKHERIPVEEPLQKFSWKNQPNAELIVKEGVEHNDYPSQIMKALNDAGISPLPEYVQLNNKIARLRLIFSG